MGQRLYRPHGDVLVRVLMKWELELHVFVTKLWSVSIDHVGREYQHLRLHVPACDEEPEEMLLLQQGKIEIE